MLLGCAGWVKLVHTNIKLNTNAILYLFHDRTVHVREGIYRGLSLRNLNTNDHFTPLSNQYNLNYRGEVVFLLFETSFFVSSC